jgi:hypothetical protein
MEPRPAHRRPRRRPGVASEAIPRGSVTSDARIGRDQEIARQIPPLPCCIFGPQASSSLSLCARRTESTVSTCPGFDDRDYVRDAQRAEDRAGPGRIRTIALPPGSAPAARSSSARLPGIGNCGRSETAAPARNSSTRRVRGSTRMTPSTCPSRCFSWMRRASAWPSDGAVSTSTPYRQFAEATKPSQARWSPRIARGTSVDHFNDRCRLEPNRPSRAACPASRIGEPPG